MADIDAESDLRWLFLILIKVKQFNNFSIRICFIRDYTLKSLRLKAGDFLLIVEKYSILCRPRLKNGGSCVCLIYHVILIITKIIMFTTIVFMTIISFTIKAEKWQKLCVSEEVKLFLTQFLDRCLPSN